MNRREHLLIIAAEECSEVAHRISKALRFGLCEIQPGQPLTNAQRILVEYQELVATIEMLSEENPKEFATGPWLNLPTTNEKKVRIEKFLVFSAKCGTLSY